MDKKEYLHTDLAIENENVAGRLATEGVIYEENEENGVSSLTVKITDAAGEQALGRSKGTYITLSFDKLWDIGEKEGAAAVTNALKKALESLFKESEEKESEKKPKRILVVGLGNRAITADAMGPSVSDRIAVTGHLAEEPALAALLPKDLLFAIAPGVIGKTGIETFSQVKSAVEASRATHVIAVDSLAALSVDRLSRTIQLTDSGIVPGSGVGNHRAALNRKTLGVPVIALGVPSIVSSSTLVCEALEKAGISEPDPALRPILENGKSFFVTLKDCDAATEALAAVIADAINQSAEAIHTRPGAAIH